MKSLNTKHYHYGRTRSLPADLPVSIDGHVSEVVKTDYGIVVWAPSHPHQPTFLLLSDDPHPHSVHGSLKRLILTLVLKLRAAESKAKAKVQDFSRRALTSGVN